MSLRATYNNIKFALQRAFKGIDKRISKGWGVQEYFADTIPEIKEFCQRYLNETDLSLKSNQKKNNVMIKTLELIKDYEEMPEEDYYKPESAMTKLFSFIVNNIGYYWD